MPLGLCHAFTGAAIVKAVAEANDPLLAGRLG